MTTAHSGSRSASVARTKERFTLWLEPQTHAALKELAHQRKRATSAVAEDFIRVGLGLVAEERLEGPALPAVRQAIDEVTGRQFDRLATLVVKGLIEASIGRRLTYAILDHDAGTDTARSIFSEAERVALAGLRRRLDDGAS